MMCHFLISACLMFGTDGSHYATKGKMSILTLLFSCLNVDSRPVSILLFLIGFFLSDYLGNL